MLRERMAALGLAGQYECPALPASPRESIDNVLALVNGIAPEKLALIGSSLGGYYATVLAERIGCRAALLNPAVAPYNDLRAHLGAQPVYFSAATIELRVEHLEELRAMDVAAITRPERYFLVAATGDAIIDYRTMVARYAGARQRVVEGSDHELSDFARYMDEVLAFCGAGTGDAGQGRSR